MQAQPGDPPTPSPSSTPPAGRRKTACSPHPLSRGQARMEEFQNLSTYDRTRFE